MIVLLCAVTGTQPAQAQESDVEDTPGTNAIARPNKAPGTHAATNESKDISPNRGTLNFVDADIESVIAAVGDYTNTTFIIDPRVKGTVTLVSEKELTKAQAFQLLTSVLRLRGYTVVTGNGYTKVVPEADAKLQAGPIQAGAVRGDQIATQIFHLKFESANNLVAVLRPLISPNNTINANPGNNTLVITDYADNLLRLDKIITALDGPASTDMDVVPIRYAVASDIAVMANRLLEAGGTPAGDAGRISVLAYPRTNSVVVRAPSEARANLAKALIEKLDQPTAQTGQCACGLPEECRSDQAGTNLARSRVIGYFRDHFGNTIIAFIALIAFFFSAGTGDAVEWWRSRIHSGRPNHQYADHHGQRVGLP